MPHPFNATNTADGLDRPHDPSVDPAAHLDALLSENPATVLDRQHSAFDRELAPVQGRVVLFGAGSYGGRVLARLRQAGIEPLAFSDNNPAVWGTSIDGLAVLAPADAAARYGASAAFIVTVYNLAHRYVDTRQQLRRLGCVRVSSTVPLRWKFHETFLPYFRDDLPHHVCAAGDDVRRAYALWADEYSRREYVAQVQWRLHGDFAAMAPPVSQEAYFPPDLIRPRPDEFFVDGGAFDGDTLKTFIARYGAAFSRVVAFEPDPSNFARLQACVDAFPADVRAKIDLRPLALGRRRARLHFNATGGESASIRPDGPVIVECVPLDEMLVGQFPTYIKLDIEGAEPDALEGGRQVISRSRPALAVCLYHRQDHLWSLPIQIGRLCSDYRLFLRTHRNDGWDVICYAIPVERTTTGRAEPPSA